MQGVLMQTVRTAGTEASAQLQENQSTGLESVGPVSQHLDAWMQHPVAPAWVVFPLAVLTGLIVLLHLSMMHDPKVFEQMPLSRRRLRTAGGVVALVAVPVLAYAFGIVTPSDPAAFTMAWSASVGILGMIVMIAAMDSLNSVRIHRKAARGHAAAGEVLKAQLQAQLQTKLVETRSATHAESTSWRIPSANDADKAADIPSDDDLR
jgi:hypothetical protein